MFSKIKLKVSYRYHKNIKVPFVRWYYKTKRQIVLKARSFHLVFKSYDQRFLYRVRVWEERSKRTINPSRLMGTPRNKGVNQDYKRASIAAKKLGVSLSHPKNWTNSSLKEVRKWASFYLYKKDRKKKFIDKLKRVKNVFK